MDSPLGNTCGKSALAMWEIVAEPRLRLHSSPLGSSRPTTFVVLINYISHSRKNEEELRTSWTSGNARRHKSDEKSLLTYASAFDAPVTLSPDIVPGLNTTKGNPFFPADRTSDSEHLTGSEQSRITCVYVKKSDHFDKG